MTILLLLLLLLVVETIAASIILRRLETRHTEVWAALKLPKAADATLSEKWLAMTMFIYSGRCFRIDDAPLSILCATLVLGEIAILYAVLFSTAA